MTERSVANRSPDDDMNALQRAAGLAMWVPGIAWLTGMLSALIAIQRFVPAERVDWLTRIYSRGQILAAGARLKTVVHPEIDPARTYVFAQNHVNMLDHCTCYAATPHFKQGIELASHFDIPFYGWFMKSRGTIPVQREGSPKEAYRDLTERIRAEVDRGHSLLLFPEGTRTLDGRVGPFQGGVFRIVHSLGLPIVPVSVVGMFEVMHKGAPYINPGKRVTVYMDKPIETKGVPKSKLPELMAEVRSVISARVDTHYAGRRSTREVAASSPDLSNQPEGT